MLSFLKPVDMDREMVLVGAALDWLQPDDGTELRLRLRSTWLQYLLLLDEHETALWQHWLDVF